MHLSKHMDFQDWVQQDASVVESNTHKSGWNKIMKFIVRDKKSVFMSSFIFSPSSDEVFKNSIDTINKFLKRSNTKQRRSKSKLKK